MYRCWLGGNIQLLHILKVKQHPVQLKIRWVTSPSWGRMDDKNWETLGFIILVYYIYNLYVINKFQIN